MHVLFVTPYFPPDIGSAQRQMRQLSTRLAAIGHEVTVLTAVPHYPTGVVPRRYRKKWCVHERMGGVRVVRTWIYATPRRRAALRMLNHLSFTAAAVGNVRAVPRDVDVIYTDSPPLLDGLAAFAIGRLRRIPYVFNVADLWPQILFEKGMLTAFPMRQMAEGLERFIYLKASQITAVTQGYVRSICEKGVPKDHVHYVPLGTDVDQFAPEVDGTQWRERLEVGGRCLVMYAGTHGESQGLETVLEAAHLLGSESQILFCFVGTGLEKASLMRFAENKGLSNVRFVDPQPLDEMPAVVAAADIHVVSLRDLPVFRMTIPGKIYEIFAAGKAVVGALAGEAAALIERASGGLTVPPMDPQELADAILFVARDAKLRAHFGRSGRSYVVANYNYAKITTMLEEVLLKAVGRYDTHSSW